MKKIIPLLLSAIVAASCGGNYARLGKEEVVKGFPRNFALSGSEVREVEVPAIVDIKHYGDRLYCMTMRPDGLITVLDERSLEPCCEPFLRLGNGPLETLTPIPFSNMYFHEEEDGLMADFFNMGNRLIRLNLSRSEAEGAVVGQSLGEVPGELMGRGPISLLGEGFFYFQSPEEQKCVRRGLWQDGEIRYAPAQERLNAFSLQDPDGFMFNLFFTSVAYNPVRRRFVEASSMQNTIHLYDQDGPFAKTLSINGPVKDYLVMAQKGMEGASMYSQTVLSFPDFFVVLYCERSLSRQSDGNPSLLFFDWDGRPLMEITLPFPVTAFDIDLSSGTLYCVDQGSDKLSVVEIDSLLKEAMLLD